MNNNITMGKPATYSGTKRIEVKYTASDWYNNRTVTISKGKDQDSWHVYIETISYDFSSPYAPATKTREYLARNIPLAQGKKMAITHLEEYAKNLASD